MCVCVCAYMLLKYRIAAYSHHWIQLTFKRNIHFEWWGMNNNNNNNNRDPIKHKQLFSVFIFFFSSSTSNSSSSLPCPRRMSKQGEIYNEAREEKKNALARAHTQLKNIFYVFLCITSHIVSAPCVIKYVN